MDVPAHHLVTHGVVVGMTGSGKTGLVTVVVEEASRNKIPVLVIDVKGDLPNLLLRFPTFSAEPLLPWVDGAALDKYSFTRDAYLQRRRNQVYDGNPPDEDTTSADAPPVPAAPATPASGTR